MQPAAIEGTTRVLGQSQGYGTLPVRDGKTIDPVSHYEIRSVSTAWVPSPEELAALNCGANIHVCLLSGGVQPPMQVSVGPVPE